MSGEMVSTLLKPSGRTDHRILVVDDDEIVRLYLECLLIENGCRVSVASDLDDVKFVLSSQKYDLIICDLVFLGQSYSGLEIVKYTQSVYPKCKAIVLTSYPSTHTAVASLRMQAVDYLTKPASQEDILNAVRRALCSSNSHMAIDSHEHDGTALSAREKDVLLHLFQGFSFSEMVQLMGCSLSTVKTYSRRIYKKLGVHSRSEAIHEALRQGLIHSE